MSKKILIICDDARLGKEYEGYIKQAFPSYSIEVKSDIDTAINRIYINGFNLAIIDIVTRSDSGYIFAKECIKLGKPVIVSTTRLPVITRLKYGMLQLTKNIKVVCGYDIYKNIIENIKSLIDRQLTSSDLINVIHRKISKLDQQT